MRNDWRKGYRSWTLNVACIVAVLALRWVSAEPGHQFRDTAVLFVFVAVAVGGLALYRRRKSP